MISLLFKRMRPAGFTLIELLIVVAIIAILAAIAVPNFLEAQTRSKVSRTKTDMRSVATALESYAVDYTKYPPDYTDGVSTFMGRLLHLTTPVAYMTTLPNDFFAKNIAESNLSISPPFKEGGVLGNPVIKPYIYDYAKFDLGYDSITVWSEITNSPGSIKWALNSPGPDITNHIYLGFPGLTIYDPTNGTVSMGQIIRTSISAEDIPKNI